MSGPDHTVWQPEVDPEIPQALRSLRRRLTNDQAPRLSLTDDDGISYDHDELVGAGHRALDALEPMLSAGEVPESHLDTAIGAIATLRAVALAVAVADNALDSTTAEHEDGAVALFDRLSRLLNDALLAADRTIVPLGEGRYRVRWRPADRQMLVGLASEIAALLDADDSSLARWFPPAYGTDEERSREYAALARDELVASKRAALEVVMSSFDRLEITSDELHSIMRALNDLRLVLGTRLDVSEDQPGPPPGTPAQELPAWHAYERLGMLVAMCVRVLSGGR